MGISPSRLFFYSPPSFGAVCSDLLLSLGVMAVCAPPGFVNEVSVIVLAARGSADLAVMVFRGSGEPAVGDVWSEDVRDRYSKTHNGLHATAITIKLTRQCHLLRSFDAMLCLG
jgi:hypothetical protein